VLRASAVCEAAGFPTSSLTCEGFIRQAAATSISLGMPNIPVALVPGHIGNKNAEDLKRDVTETTVQAVIDTRTLRAPVSMAQGELRGADFFDVAVYPQMLFKSRSVRPKTATSAEIIGDITVKGVTRPIVLQATLQPPGAGGAREFRAKTRINRNDFKMTAYALLVGDTVDIEIRALLRPQ